MQIPKPSESDKDAFAAAIAPIEGAVVKPMFGNLGAFVSGNMFAGLFGSDLGVRLTDPSAVDELAGIPGTGPFGPSERPMGGYRSLPPDWPEQPDLVAEWVSKAFQQVSELAPKVAKPKKPKGGPRK
jgi:TfoX/Sxy family transcriptional regulator of competence genes